MVEIHWEWSGINGTHKGSGNPMAPKILDLIVVFFRSGEKVSMKRAILRAFHLVIRTKVQKFAPRALFQEGGKDVWEGPLIMSGNLVDQRVCILGYHWYLLAHHYQSHSLQGLQSFSSSN